MVWLLTALWIFPFAVKSTHIHHCEAFPEASGATHHHHHCDDCPICQFALSAYVETPSFRLAPVRTFILFISASPQKKLYTQSYLSTTPRAPPREVYSLL
jgi:hypothetical protein